MTVALGRRIRLQYTCTAKCQHLTKDDAPAILRYGMAMDAKPDIHHPLFGKLLKEKMDQLGIRCKMYAGREVLAGGEQDSVVEFIKQEFAKVPR